MKLPENKQERVKLFVVVGLGVALAILGIVQGVINPLRASQANKLATLDDQQRATDKAHREIRAAANSYSSRIEAIAKIKDISDRHVLHPVLGNYLLGATPIVEALAQAAGVEIEPVREIGISEIPGAAGKNVKAYNVRITLQGGFHDAIRFLREIENGNPFATVTGVLISTRAETPQNHAISIEAQWPIWTDPSMPENLASQLEEEAGDGRQSREGTP